MTAAKTLLLALILTLAGCSDVDRKKEQVDLCASSCPGGMKSVSVGKTTAYSPASARVVYFGVDDVTNVESDEDAPEGAMWSIERAVLDARCQEQS